MSMSFGVESFVEACFVKRRRRKLRTMSAALRLGEIALVCWNVELQEPRDIPLGSCFLEMEVSSFENDNRRCPHGRDNEEKFLTWNNGRLSATHLLLSPEMGGGKGSAVSVSHAKVRIQRENCAWSAMLRACHMKGGSLRKVINSAVKKAPAFPKRPVFRCNASLVIHSASLGYHRGKQKLSPMPFSVIHNTKLLPSRSK